MWFPAIPSWSKISRLLPRSIALVLLVCAPSGAQAQSSAPQSARLANGLQLVVLEDSRAPVVTHAVAYRLGSKDDPPHLTGLAHFLEHMMFKPLGASAPNYRAQIEEMGGRINAFTSKGATVYFASVPREGLELVLAWEARRMRALPGDAAAALTERDVVLEEYQGSLGSRPAAQLRREVAAVLWRGTPFAAPVIGAREHIARYTMADARRLHRRFYSPNNAIVIMAGAITMPEARALAQRYYGALAARTRVPTRARAPAPFAANTPVTLSDPRVRQASWSKVYRLPPWDAAQLQRYAALDVLSEIVGGSQTGRLYHAHVVDEPRFVRIGAWFNDSHPQAPSWGIYASPQGTPRAETYGRLIEDALGEIAISPPPAEEMARAKTALLASFYYAQDDQLDLALHYASRLANGYTLEQLLAWPQKLEALEPADIQAAAQWLLAQPSLEASLLHASGDAASNERAP